MSQDDALNTAEAILREVQTQTPRAAVEALLKTVLQTAYPYGLSAIEIGKRLGLPEAPRVLAYLCMWKEVEKIASGRYRYVPPPGGAL